MEFKELSVKELEQINGGKKYADYLVEFGVGGAVAGATGGAAWGGIGAIPGAFLGAHVGVIAGSIAYVSENVIDRKWD